MEICITGYSGFVGSYIIKKLPKKFSIRKINLRKIPILETGNYDRYLNKFNKANIIINFASAIYPKTKHDFFINQDFPKILENHMKKKKKNFLLIHISTTNVLNKKIRDPYTNSKRIAEKKLLNTKSTILRLPLIIHKKKGRLHNSGNLKFFFKYLNINLLPIYPMIYPGTKFEPVTLEQLSKFTNKIIIKKKVMKVYNISGGYTLNMWELFEEVAKLKNKKILKINLSFLNIILPSFVKKLLGRSNGNLKHLLILNNTKFNEKKTIFK